MKTINIICHFAVALLLAESMAGCRQTASDMTHEHDENLQLTAYNDLFEVYAEVSPLVVNEAAEVVAHFTWLRDFKPLEEGTVTATLTVGGKTISQMMETPVREGIYKFSLTPPAEGNGQMVFEIRGKEGSSTLTAPAITVYGDAHTAQHAAADAKATSSNGVVFTKEMSWKVDFSTDSCRVRPFGQVIHTMAQVQPAQGDEYVISAQADGIVRLNGELTEGKEVKAGQSLFSIESKGLAEGNLDVRYREAENDYQLAKAEYERKKALAEDKIVSESELLQAKRDFENAETRYQHLRRNFASGRQTLGAPIGGYLRRLSVRNGDFVSAGQPLAVVSQNRNLFVKAEVQPKYYPLLADIATATFRIGNDGTTYSLEELNGKLVSYGKSTDLQNPLVSVMFQIDNKIDRLPGSFVELFIRTQGHQPVITVPNASLIEEMDNYFMYVQLTPEYFEKRQVSIGKTDGLNTEITSGLNGSERVVVNGSVLVKIMQSSGGLDAESGHQH